MSSQAVTVNVGERVVNLSTALPFKLGDWRKLRDKGVDIIKMPALAKSGEFSLEHMVIIAEVALSKADPTLPADAVNELTLPDLNTIATAVLDSERPGGGGGVDRPTSTGSTSSPSSGAGDPATSTN